MKAIDLYRKTNWAIKLEFYDRATRETLKAPQQLKERNVYMIFPTHQTNVLRVACY